jgi:hypothetical protein
MSNRKLNDYNILTTGMVTSEGLTIIPRAGTLHLESPARTEHGKTFAFPGQGARQDVTLELAGVTWNLKPLPRYRARPHWWPKANSSECVKRGES